MGLTIIHLWAEHNATINCYICGAEDTNNWGVPIHNGDLVSNDFEGEWSGAPACRKCYAAHARGELETFDHLC